MFDSPNLTMIDQDYLTIKEAAKFVGTSERTMRRRIIEITNGETETAAADRFHILPTVKEKEEGSKEKWRINKALLHQLFPEANQKQKDADENTAKGIDDRMLNLLEKQQATLDKMIEKVETENTELKNELKQANVEIDDLKQKLLPAVSGQPEPNNEKNDPQPEPNAETETPPIATITKTEEVANEAKEKAVKGILRSVASYFSGA